MDETDRKLLAEYVQQKSEAAFRRIVDRYAGLVYNSAYRRLQDHHLAEDAAQATFIILAMKAGKLRRTTMLGGWLWRTTANVARNLERERAARARRERGAAAHRAENGEATWERIAPELDVALAALPAVPRAALIAHYLLGKSQQQVATELHVHVNTVQRHIRSGVEALRRILAAKGMVAPSVLLASLLSARSSEAVPVELCDSIHKVAFGIGTGAIAASGHAYAAAKGVMRMMMWAKLRMAAVCACVLAGATGIAMAVAARDMPPGAWQLITPTPKRITVARQTVSTEGATILLAGAHPKLTIAAEEINHRLTKELGAPALPVEKGGVAELQRSDQAMIVIGISGTPAMVAIEHRCPVAVPNRVEGYGIATHRQGSRTVVVLSGRDAQGALYAAVTLRHLLDPADEARIPNCRAVLRAATVEDWPDYRWRQAGYGLRFWRVRRNCNENGIKRFEDQGKALVDENQALVDRFLRHKINLAIGFLSPHLAKADPRLWRYARQINDYARARGVDFDLNHASTCIGTHPADKDDHQRSRCIHMGCHKKYYCWSLLDEHRKRAEEFAELMSACGLRWLFLHDVDGGAWKNPAMWQNRCEHCKRMYGDDQGKATATIFNLYHDVIRQKVPDLQMIAVVYPYAGGWIDPDAIEGAIRRESGPIPNARELAEKITGRHQAMLRRVNELMRPEIKVCLRETPRSSYRLMSECYGKRDFQMYMCVTTGWGDGWKPQFSMEPAWAGTFYRPDHEDVLWPCRTTRGYDIPVELAAAEFCWNTKAPGAQEYPKRRGTTIENAIAPREISAKYVHRFCLDYWGPRIGPHMVPVFDSNISLTFITEPDVVASTLRIADPAGKMREMIQATSRAMASLETARAVYDAAVAEGRVPITDRNAERNLGDYYRFMLTARALAAFRAPMTEARAAVMAGDMAKADRLLAEARSVIRREKAEWNQRRDWMERVPHNYRDRWLYLGRFSGESFDALQEETVQFEQEKDALFEAHNTPKWFQKALSERVLYAVPATTTPEIDGRLDEEVWLKAPKNEHFVNHKTSTPAEKETAARILYDADTLYVGYTAYEPAADRIRVQKTARDTWDSEHSVELFVDANRDKESYVQYIWDISGNIFDGRTRRDSNGMLASDHKGFTSTTRYAVARYPDRWTLEAAIPAAEFGSPPRAEAAWRANLCRNLRRADGERESVSTVMLKGSGFHTPEKFADLRFLKAVPPERAPVINFRVSTRRAGQVTTDTGTGFEAVFDVTMDTTRPLHHASLQAEVFSGEVRKGNLTMFRGRTVQLLWRTREPARYLADAPEPGLQFVFRLTSDEGEWSFVERFGSPRPRAARADYIPGVSGLALNGTARFPALAGGSRLFDSRQGTLEMWVQVSTLPQAAAGFGPTPNHVFFHHGPVRHDHPTLANHRSVCVRRIGQQISANLSTATWQQLSTNGSLHSWGSGGWHHLAAQWSAADPSTLGFELYLDGTRASWDARTQTHGKEWKKELEPFFVQLGSMITGACPLGWAIDEIRISAAPRYTGSFTPPRKAALDENATVIFHFDGCLDGLTRTGTKVVAVVGPGA